MLQILRVKARIYENFHDEKLISPSDFTVMLSNLPKKVTDIDIKGSPIKKFKECN